MNEEKIIKRCQMGDLSAYKELFHRYEQPLLHTAFRMLRQQQDAEDAVQTTFIKLFKSVQNYRFDARFSTYLFRILMNVCFDMIKRKKRMRSLPIQDTHSAYRFDPELKIELEQAIKALPNKMRACFVLFAMEEIKQTDIADIMGLSVGGVKSNIYHAKNRLRAYLSRDNNEM